MADTNFPEEPRIHRFAIGYLRFAIWGRGGVRCSMFDVLCSMLDVRCSCQSAQSAFLFVAVREIRVSQTIQRALHPAPALPQHMRVDHRRGHILVPQQLLHRPNVRPAQPERTRTPNIQLRTSNSEPGCLPLPLLRRLDAAHENPDQLVGLLHQRLRQPWTHQRHALD